MARVKKTRKNDPSYKRRRSTAPDTQRTVSLVSLTPTSTLKLGQADRVLSGLNHRLYRQHGTYRLKIDLLSSSSASSIKVWALANTWYNKRAIQMAKQIHDFATDEERAMGIQSRWYDFRIDHNTQGGIDELVTDLRNAPAGPSTPSAHPGEYSVSVIQDAAGAMKEFRLLGPTSATGWNIFTEYDNLGNTMRDPDAALPSGAGYDGADATIAGGNIEAMANRGDLPPYNHTNFATEQFVEVANLYRHAGGGSFTGNQRLSTGFFDAPLGLFWVQYGSADQDVRLQLECKAGNYKGVHMEAY